MTHADAFLQDIFAHPDDDTPRLIYADWLEETGDPASAARAEFIRVQCTLALGCLPARRRTILDVRQQQLLDQYAHEWMRPVRRLLRTWTFHRGFLDEVSLWTGRFLDYAGRLFRHAPIQHVRLRRKISEAAEQRFNLPRLAACEHLRHLRSLDLSDNLLESRDLRALLVSEHLTCLTSLNLAGNRIGDSGIRALAEAPLLGQLMYLNLRDNELGAGGLRALTEALERLASSSEGLRLLKVDLQGNKLSMAGRGVLAGSPLLQRLTRG